MSAFYFVLLLVAVVLFLVSALSNRVFKVDLISLGLAFAFAVPLIQFFHKL